MRFRWRPTCSAVAASVAAPSRRTGGPRARDRPRGRDRDRQAHRSRSPSRLSHAAGARARRTAPTATDQAGNQRSTATLADGDPATVTLPVRATTYLIAGRPTRARHRRGLAHHLLVGHLSRPLLQGRLTDAHHHPLAAAPITILQRAPGAGSPWRALRTITTTKTGRLHFRLGAGTDRLIRIRYPGTPTVRPSAVNVQVGVRAATTFHVDHHRVPSGGRVTLTGVLRGGHIPAGGVLILLQVLVNGHWQDFATTHAGTHGAWHHTYHFLGTYRSTTYHFRVQVGPTAGYPYVAAPSHAVAITVHAP
jgi:hypothetical protein